MRRIGLLFVAACVLFVSGCGTDERKPVIDDVIDQVSKVTAKVSTIRNKVADAVTQAEKKAEKEERSVKASDLTAADLQPATDAVKAFKDSSKAFLNAARNAQNDNYITPEEQERYRKEFGERLQTNLSSMQKATDELQKAVNSAAKINPASTKDLEKSWVEAKAEFDSVVKRN